MERVVGPRNICSIYCQERFFESVMIGSGPERYCPSRRGNGFLEHFAPRRPRGQHGVDANNTFISYLEDVGNPQSHGLQKFLSSLILFFF